MTYLASFFGVMLMIGVCAPAASSEPTQIASVSGHCDTELGSSDWRTTTSGQAPYGVLYRGRFTNGPGYLAAGGFGRFGGPDTTWTVDGYVNTFPPPSEQTIFGSVGCDGGRSLDYSLTAFAVPLGGSTFSGVTSPSDFGEYSSVMAFQPRGACTIPAGMCNKRYFADVNVSQGQVNFDASQPGHWGVEGTAGLGLTTFKLENAYPPDGLVRFGVTAANPVPAVWTVRIREESVPTGGRGKRPNTFFTKKPPAKSHRTTARFRFRSSIGGSRFRCEYARGWSGCRSPVIFRKLPPGRYIFRVRAVKHGKADRSPATWKFTVASNRHKRSVPRVEQPGFYLPPSSWR